MASILHRGLFYLNLFRNISFKVTAIPISKETMWLNKKARGLWFEQVESDGGMEEAITVRCPQHLSY